MEPPEPTTPQVEGQASLVGSTVPDDPVAFIDTLLAVGTRPEEAWVQTWGLPSAQCRAAAMRSAGDWLRREGWKGAKELFSAFEVLVRADREFALQTLQNCEGLEIANSMDLTGLRDLVRLPEDLHVRGILHVHACSDFSTVPGSTQVEKQLILSHCLSLEHLGEGLEADELFISDCPALSRLPVNLSHIRRLQVTSCSGLMGLPDEMRLQNGIFLDCTFLQDLGKGIRVSQTLSFRNCRSLRSLPDQLHIGAHLLLVDLPGITTLPADLSIDGDLALTRCENWDGTVPETARIGGRIITDLPSPAGRKDGREWHVGVPIGDWLQVEAAKISVRTLSIG